MVNPLKILVRPMFKHRIDDPLELSQAGNERANQSACASGTPTADHASALQGAIVEIEPSHTDKDGNVLISQTTPPRQIANRELSRCPLKCSEPLHGYSYAAFFVEAGCGSVCSVLIIASTGAISA